MKLILVIFLSFSTLTLFSNSKTSYFDTSIKRYNYIEIKRSYFRNYPSHIQYSKYVLYDPGEYLGIRNKKLNKILDSIDTIYHLNISYLKGFNSCNKINALTKVKSLVVTYNTGDNIDVFSLKNINKLFVGTKDCKRIHINEINNNLSYLSTTNQLDSTLLNLKVLDSLFWRTAQIDSISSMSISNHPHLQFLRMGTLNKFTSKNDINNIINILSRSKSINKFEIYNWRFEEGTILKLEEFCKSNNIELILPLRYTEMPINEWH